MAELEELSRDDHDQRLRDFHEQENEELQNEVDSLSKKLKERNISDGPSNTSITPAKPKANQNTRSHNIQWRAKDETHISSKHDAQSER